MKDISIIIPVYNVKHKLFKKCINSVLNQTYKNIEVILIDDGSNTIYKKFYQTIANTDNRINLFIKENGGPSSARNLGITKAQGKYIMFVDADDYIEEDYCQSFKTAIEKKFDVAIASCFVHHGSKIEKITNYYSNSIVLNDKQQIELLSSILNDNGAKFRFVGTPWSKLYKKEFLEKNNITFKEDIFMGEDGLFNYEVYSLADKIYYLNKPLYHYVDNDKSICHRFNKNIVENYDKIFNHYEILFKSKRGIYIEDEYLCFGFWKICYLLESYFCNNRNSKSYNELKKEFINKMKQEPYKSFIKKVDFHKLYHERRIIRLFIKFNFFRLLNHIV